MKIRLWQIVAALGLAAGIAAWLLIGKDSPPAAATPRATESVPELSRTNVVPAVAMPAGALPKAGIDFTETSSEEELLALARKLVDRSPAEALAWAQSQNDPDLRLRLLRPVLVAWGERDPRAAMSWVLGQGEDLKFDGVGAVLSGAAVQTDLALQLGRELFRDEAMRGAYGYMLASALSSRGKFSEALQFTGEVPADTAPAWLATLFTRWSETRPDEAAKALGSIEDKDQRAAAFHALIAGWSAGNPSGLAAYAAQLPPGDDRTMALDAALGNWSLQDPAAAGEWLNAQPPSPELDKAIAGLIATTDSVNRSPEVAMSWVESISDPKLRHDTLMQVMQQWAQSEPETAWKYFDKVSWLNPNDREETRQAIQKKIDAAKLLPDKD